LIEGRENGDLEAVAPYSGVPLNLKMNETHILIRLLHMYIPRNWEFGSALAKLHNFGRGGGLNPLKPPFGKPLYRRRSGSELTKYDKNGAQP
jgi:hypothetical protein